MIKNERGVTIRARADEVFSIRMAMLRDRLCPTKGSETVYWLFRLSSCQSRYRVTDPTSQSVSQRIVFCVLATKARNPRYATSIPMFQPLSLSLSLSLSLFHSLFVPPSLSSRFAPSVLCFISFHFSIRLSSPFSPPARSLVVLTSAFLHPFRVKKRFAHISMCN